MMFAKLFLFSSRENRNMGPRGVGFGYHAGCFMVSIVAHKLESDVGIVVIHDYTAKLIFWEEIHHTLSPRDSHGGYSDYSWIAY